MWFGLIFDAFFSGLDLLVRLLQPPERRSETVFAGAEAEEYLKWGRARFAEGKDFSTVAWVKHKEALSALSSGQTVDARLLGIGGL
jgi:hypothetical protein